MAIGNTVNGDLKIVGGQVILDANQSAPLTPIPRTVLIQNPLAVFPVLMTDWTVWDSGQPLPASAASDDLTVSVGTWGTNAPALSAGDVKASSPTRRAATVISLPAEYDPGETINIRVSAGMLTTIADGSCTVDIEVFKVGRDSLVSGSDLCATAAQSINSLTFADKTFVITAAGLVAGDQLHVRLTIAAVDAATGTAVKPTVGSVELLADIKG